MRAHPAGALHADVIPAPTAYGVPPADLNRVDPAVWPYGSKRDNGVLTLGGCDVRDLVGEYGSPAYVLVEDDVRARCRAFRAAFGDDTDIYYAAKAFLSMDFARWILAEGLSLDVASGGELATALAAGFPPERLVLHGNNKSMDELRSAVTAGVGRIVLDSEMEIARLAHVAEEAGVRQRVLVRVTVGVEAHTHEFIATAHEDQKFGFSLSSGAAMEGVRRTLALPSLELVGLHSHIGSQIFDAAGFEVAAHRIIQFAASVRDALGVTVAELDLGGGFGIAYTSDDDPADISEIAKQLRSIVERECEASALGRIRLGFEPGRAIVGPAGVTLYEVGTIKDVDGIRTYVSIDGGMSDNVRTALYDASYTVVLASRSSDAEPMLARVVGKHCEAGDIVVRDAWLPADLAPGDLLAVAATGAYCRSMASNYNAVLRPPVVAVSDGTSRLLMRRETLDDLLALDQG